MIFIHRSIAEQIVFGIVLGVMVTKVANLATTIYLHRYLTHGSFKLARWVQNVFRFIIWVTTGLIPRVWAGVHQQHHAHVDEPGVGGDPHSPVVLGTANVLFKNAYYYRKASHWPVVERRSQAIWLNRNGGRDRLDHRFDQPYLGLTIGITLAIVVFGPVTGLVLSVVHAAWYLFLSGVINSFAHRFGTRPSRGGGSATNFWIPVGCGEGWHNNHHAQPNSARLGVRWWQIDMGKYGIWLLERVRLVWDVQRPKLT